MFTLIPQKQAANASWSMLNDEKRYGLPGVNNLNFKKIYALTVAEWIESWTFSSKFEFFLIEWIEEINPYFLRTKNLNTLLRPEEFPYCNGSNFRENAWSGLCIEVAQKYWDQSKTGHITKKVKSDERRIKARLSGMCLFHASAAWKNSIHWAVYCTDAIVATFVSSHQQSIFVE